VTKLGNNCLNGNLKSAAQFGHLVKVSTSYRKGSSVLRVVLSWYG